RIAQGLTASNVAKLSVEDHRRMDESWTMGMGVATRLKPKPSLPRRRSTEETSARRAVFGAESEAPHPEDFSDVFGGPPRTVLLRQFSTCDLNRSPTPFYEEIFRKPEAVVPARTGRNLPVFRIPASRERSQEFYSDIFGKEDDVRRSRSRSKSKSKSKSKSNSSSVLSSEELSPLPVADDGSFWSFSSKLSLDGQYRHDNTAWRNPPNRGRQKNMER
ncbi:hypothetical protein U1Q18_009663, partial [Sarracenia purpurea var. burkii]